MKLETKTGKVVYENSEVTSTKELLEQAVAHNVKLSGVTLIAKNINNVNLDGANLAGITFERCNVNEASLVGANMKNCTIDRCNFNKTELSSADMTNSNITCSNFSEALIIGTILDGATIDRSSINSAYKSLEEKAEGDKRKAEMEERMNRYKNKED